MIYTVVNITHPLMITASKTTYKSNLKILKSQLSKMLRICVRSLVNSHPDVLTIFLRFWDLGLISPTCLQAFTFEDPKSSKRQ